MKRMIFICMGLFTATMLLAQSPAAFKYQAVVRDASGSILVNKNVSLRITILEGSVTGTNVYSERQYVNTNGFGLVNLDIGRGINDTGTIMGINWGADRHFINIELDPNGGNAFQFMGVSELLSVPYAIQARTVQFGDKWQQQGDDISYTKGSVAIGTTEASPGSVLTLYADTLTSLSFQNAQTQSTNSFGLYLGFLKNAGIISTFNYPLYLSTLGYTRMTITKDGEIGMGTQAPASQLHISSYSTLTKPQLLLEDNGQDYARLMFKNGYSSTKNWTIAGAPWATDAGSRLNFWYDNGTNGTDILSITGDGKVGINTTSPTQALHVVGNAYKTDGGTTWATSSDLRLKTIRGKYSKGLDEIIALQPVRFVYNQDNPRKLDSNCEQVGFIAQDVQQIFPEAVEEAADGYLDFNMHPINVALVNAVKELKAENDRLRERVEKLEISITAERRR